MATSAEHEILVRDSTFMALHPTNPNSLDWDLYTHACYLTFPSTGVGALSAPRLWTAAHLDRRKASPVFLKMKLQVPQSCPEDRPHIHTGL